MKKFISKWWPVAAIIFVTALAIFAKPYGIIALPIIILFFSMVFPRHTKSTSLIFHSIFLFVILTCVVQVLGVVFWILKIDLVYELLVVVLAISTIATYVIRGFALNYKSFVNKDDIFSGIIAMFAVILMTIGILHGGSTSQQILRFLATGFDARQHLSMAVSDYENHGYILGFDEKAGQQIVYPSLGSYPQGWHLNTSLAMSGISDNLTFMDNYKEILAIFFTTIMFWYGLITFLVSRAILYIIRALKNIKNYIAYAVTLSAAILFQTTLLMSVVGYGFANFLPAIVYLLVLLIMGVYLHQSAVTQKKSSLIIYGSLLIAGTSFSWSLATPMAVLLVAAYWLIGFDKWKDIVKWLRKNILPIIVSFIILILSALPFIQALTDEYSTVSNHINDNGGIYSVSFIFVTAIFLISLIGLIKLGDGKLRLILLSSLILPAAVYGAVNTYQYFTTGIATYFSIKVLSLSLVFIIVVFGAIGAKYINTVAGGINKIILITLILSIGLLLAPLSGYDMKGVRLLSNESKSLSLDSSSKIIEMLDNKLIFSSNLFVIKDNFEEDVLTTLLVGSMSRTYPSCTQSFILHKIKGDRQASIYDVTRCASQNQNKNYFVISSLSNTDELRQIFGDYKNITIIPSV